jgi:hypothetical protein
MILTQLYIYIYIFGFGLICLDNFVYFFFFWINFGWKGPKIMLVGAQKLFEGGQLIFYTYSSCFFFLEPAGAMAPFGPQVAPSLLVSYQ